MFVSSVPNAVLLSRMSLNHGLIACTLRRKQHTYLVAVLAGFQSISIACLSSNMLRLRASLHTPAGNCVQPSEGALQSRVRDCSHRCTGVG